MGLWTCHFGSDNVQKPLQMPGSEEPYQEQLERLRQLSRDVQGEFDTVDGIISRGTRRLTDLQSQASNLRMQVRCFSFSHPTNEQEHIILRKICRSALIVIADTDS